MNGQRKEVSISGDRDGRVKELEFFTLSVFSTWGTGTSQEGWPAVFSAGCGCDQVATASKHLYKIYLGKWVFDLGVITLHRSVPR